MCAPERRRAEEVFFALADPTFGDVSRIAGSRAAPVSRSRAIGAWRDRARIAWRGAGETAGIDRNFLRR